MKNVVKCQKHFFGYLNALKTHSVALSAPSQLFQFFIPLLTQLPHLALHAVFKLTTMSIELKQGWSFLAYGKQKIFKKNLIFMFKNISVVNKLSLIAIKTSLSWILPCTSLFCSKHQVELIRERPLMTSHVCWPFLTYLHTRCPVPSTDQALPSCFYFRIS